ncbi:Dyp-type peroxidase [Flexivirga sp. ID2601S]|uniref:Dyp-type peroxidase n=2 Tax=Flexivirga aerilata TaxID=1656889 RepID=A0A849AKJ4_9MICO|nr:Dyp-type peroxidase [Flexivirga aerilata]
MSTDHGSVPNLADVQAAVLQPRPTPYAGTYLALRIDDRRQARALVQRMLPMLDSVASFDAERQVSLAIGFSFEGLRAIGVPEDSLATFSPEFQQGMAARAAELGDVGDSSPANWEGPLGSKDVHLMLVGLAPDAPRLEAILLLARDALRDLPGVATIWQQEVFAAPNEREPFGFKDGIGQPAIEGAAIPCTNSREERLKAGEFLLGFEDETGSIAAVPQPDILGRGGTYAAFRKLHTRVADFRQYLRDRAADRADEELLAAKVVGRWPSGAPLPLSPDRDDPELGADPHRNNDFQYGDDPRGLKCPLGSHARRMNPRDAIITGEVRLHRMIRRGTNYGPPLPQGVYEDDGADRGIVFAFIGAHLARQFEFVQAQWVNDGKFIGVPVEKDPLVGANDDGQFTVPRTPIRRRFQGLPPFVVNRGGEYCFLPSLSALRWIADLDT